MIQALRDRPGLILFAAVWLVYNACPPFLSYDSYWTVATAVNLVDHGSTQVDRFVAAAPAAAAYGLECVPAEGAPRMKYEAAGCAGGHWYSYFPPGEPVLVAPLIAILKIAISAVGPLAPRTGFFARTEVAAFFAGNLVTGRPLTELFCAALIGAATVWVMYRIALLFLSERGAIGLALLFAFGTTEWSLASRNLYPHGLTVLLLSGALWALLRERPATAGLLLALSFCVRPSNAVSCVVLLAYVALHRRKQLARFVAAAAPVAIVFAVYQVAVRHSAIPLYLTAPRNSVTFAEGLAMNFVSPSRGLFVFTPVFLLSIAGIVIGWRRRWCFPLLPYLAAILVLHALVVMTLWPGHCYGPRYFADMTHLFVLFLIPALDRVPRWLLIALAAFGIFVHSHGATSIAANQWSALPVNVDDARGRVWDWSDPQFLRGLK